jgi:hypothetical protein
MLSTYVHCHVDYACSVWYSGLSKILNQKLQICQNKMVRFVMNLDLQTSVNYATLIHLNLLNIQDKVYQLRLNHVFSIAHGRAPSYLIEHSLLRFNYSNYHITSMQILFYHLSNINNMRIILLQWH